MEKEFTKGEGSAVFSPRDVELTINKFFLFSNISGKMLFLHATHHVIAPTHEIYDPRVRTRKEQRKS